MGAVRPMRSYLVPAGRRPEIETRGTAMRIFLNAILRGAGYALGRALARMLGA